MHTKPPQPPSKSPKCLTDTNYLQKVKLQDWYNVLLYKNICRHFLQVHFNCVSLTSVTIGQRHHSQSLSRMSTRLKKAYVLKENYLN